MQNTPFIEFDRPRINSERPRFAADAPADDVNLEIVMRFVQHCRSGQHRKVAQVMGALNLEYDELSPERIRDAVRIVAEQVTKQYGLSAN
jgi:hypothetical protein